MTLGTWQRTRAEGKPKDLKVPFSMPIPLDVFLRAATVAQDTPPRPDLADAVRDFVNAQPASREAGRPGGAAGRSDPAGSDLASAVEAVGVQFGRPVASNPAAPTGPVHLADAVQDYVKYEAAKPKYLAPTEATWKRWIQPVAALVMFAAAGYLFFAKPDWLYPTVKPSTMAVGKKAKLQMNAVAILMDQYRKQYGRVATDPAQLNFPIRGLRILDQGNGAYQLRTAGSGPGLFLDGAPGAGHRFGELVQ